MYYRMPSGYCCWINPQGVVYVYGPHGWQESDFDKEYVTSNGHPITLMEVRY